MCLYCKILLNLQTKRKNKFDILVKFPIGCLQCGPHSTCVYCDSFYKRRRVLVDFIRLADVKSKSLYAHFFIAS